MAATREDVIEYLKEYDPARGLRTGEGTRRNIWRFSGSSCCRSGSGRSGGGEAAAAAEEKTEFDVILQASWWQ